MKKKTLIIVICLLFIPAHSLSSERSWKWIKPGKLYSLMKEGSGVWLVDVRNSALYESMHIEGSVNIPVAFLKNKKFPKSRFFVLADSSPGQMLAMDAADALAERGYVNVYVLESGIKGWELEAYPTVRGEGLTVFNVTARELSWALDNSVPMEIFDLRGDGMSVETTIPGSRFVDGNSIEEKLGKLRNLLKEDSSLSNKLTPREMVVVVFSASEDAEHYTQLLSDGLKRDVRYLLGGYEVYGALNVGEFGEKGKAGAEGYCREKR